MDIIQLLPDAIANQIAAGEVVQRPASVVKELLENAVDAGSTKIQLIIKDAGKTLIQVIDNGKGMSAADARMCFARHATSKIRSAEDLFSIRTMGFRGEAMASIAAVAQVELKTRQVSEELGTRLVIEASEVKEEAPCQHSEGTSVAVKNLFYNIPARRNFLKTNAVEMRHILDEFQRVALANAEIQFSLIHNGLELFHLPTSKLRPRVVGVLGNHTNKRLVPLHEETDAVKMHGFVGKPEYAKKTRGDQFFFVNNRFIKSAYLHHAVMAAYENLLPEGTYPLYVIFLEIDPARIDINVHPTKQEIKFEDERLVYDYLRVTVRHTLARHSITPTLDFDVDSSISKHLEGQPKDAQTVRDKFKAITSPQSGGDNIKSDYFKSPSFLEKMNLKNWEKLYEDLDDEEEVTEELTLSSKLSEERTPIDDEKASFSRQRKKPYQIHNRYIVSQIKSGFLLIDQQAAHERILYERYQQALSEQQPLSQQQLFPQSIELSTSDVPLLKELLPKLEALGLDVREFGQDTFVVHGVPAHLKHIGHPQEVIEQLLEQYQANRNLEIDLEDNLARAMARSAAIKRGQELEVAEMQQLIDELFACALPHRTPAGRRTLSTFELAELDKRFE